MSAMALAEERIPLRWSGIFAGAVVALAIGWAGDLVGGLLAMIQPGESSFWGWLGGFITLAFVVTGAAIGGYLASRCAGGLTRNEGAVHGLLVWGLFGAVSALTFAILGGNVSLVTGNSPGRIRLALGFGSLGLIFALGAALLGGALGRTSLKVRKGIRERIRQGLREEVEYARAPGVATPPPGTEREVLVSRQTAPGEHASPEQRESYRTGASFPEEYPPEGRGSGEPPPSVH
ncbi:MAG: hypothetical protein HY901_18260 [Deltaproteobacteria bacterium]|nr:hypothetical protein [Deltaproteobacteria bacterium]